MEWICPLRNPFVEASINDILAKGQNNQFSEVETGEECKQVLIEDGQCRFDDRIGCENIM